MRVLAARVLYLVLKVFVGARGQKRLHNAGVTLVRGLHKRRVSILTAEADIKRWEQNKFKEKIKKKPRR